MLLPSRHICFSSIWLTNEHLFTRKHTRAAAAIRSLCHLCIMHLLSFNYYLDRPYFILASSLYPLFCRNMIIRTLYRRLCLLICLIFVIYIHFFPLFTLFAVSSSSSPICVCVFVCVSFYIFSAYYFQGKNATFEYFVL